MCHLILFAMLCRAVKDKPVMALTALQVAAIVADGITTRQDIKSGCCVEKDPFARAFLGPRPTWNRMAPLGAAQVVGEVWLSEKLKGARGRERHLWWLPLTIGTADNLGGISANVIAKDGWKPPASPVNLPIVHDSLEVR